MWLLQEAVASEYLLIRSSISSSLFLSLILSVAQPLFLDPLDNDVNRIALKSRESFKNVKEIEGAEEEEEVEGVEEEEEIEGVEEEDEIEGVEDVEGAEEEEEVEGAEEEEDVEGAERIEDTRYGGVELFEFNVFDLHPTNSNTSLNDSVDCKWYR